MAVACIKRACDDVVSAVLFTSNSASIVYDGSGGGSSTATASRLGG